VIGRTLSHYKIVSKLGEGGMGAVYLAEDSTLGREVALKVLPAEMVGDPERLERFQREARSVAALNHPNIVTLHSVEEADGVPFLTMERVEGRSLDQLLPPSGFTLDQLFPLAIQIADALAAAHDKGITHRDLKPANVMVTAEGRVKILDFGLAKLAEQETEEEQTQLMTQAGMILGTVPYMSPEQIQGQAVDSRADIFSLGILLYEMATGRRPFSGDNPASVISAVLKDEPPPVTTVRAGLPNHLGRIIRRCLEKLPQRRFQSARDVQLELEDLQKELATAGDRPASTAGAMPVGGFSASGHGAPAAPTAPNARRPLHTWGWVAALLLAGLAAWGWLGRPPAQQADLPLTWLTIPPSPGDFQSYDPDSRSVATLSPDGGTVVYAVRSGGDKWLARRDLDHPESVRLEGSQGARQRFFSPDGRSIAFTGAGRMLAIPAVGGSAREICSPCNARYGGTWSADGSIVFTPNWASPLMIVPATGGRPQPLTELEGERGDISHLFPFAMPGGTHVLFSIWMPEADDRLAAVVRLADRQVTIVARGGNFYRYVAGHLLYERRGVLFALPFDSDALEVTGQPVAITGRLQRINADGFAAFSVSANGMLAFQHGRDGQLRQALWVDRDGHTEPALNEPGPFSNPALSADGRLLAMAVPVEDSGYRVQVYDLAGGTRVELTPKGDNLVPLFSPDSRDVLYVSSAFDDYVIARAAVDGSTPPEVAIDTTGYAGPTDWSPDGRSLVFDMQDPEGNSAIWILTEGEAEPRRIADTPALESGATFSPDGHWIVYASDATGRRELYLVPADGQAAPRQITQSGVGGARWSPAGGEIFIERQEALWSLPIETQPSLRVGTPARLFNLPRKKSINDARPEFDVTPDGQRFIMLQDLEPDPEFLTIQVIQNLPELIRRRAQGR